MPLKNISGVLTALPARHRHNYINKNEVNQFDDKDEDDD